MTHKEKQKVISKLVSVPNKDKRNFWSKEIKFLNILYEIYPSSKFWMSLSFPTTLDSMLLLRSGYYAQQLKSKYNLFKYLPKKDTPIKLGKKPAEDIVINQKNKTVKDFLL